MKEQRIKNKIRRLRFEANEMTPIFIAQLLLMTLVASSTVKSLSRLYHYRKVM